MTDRELYHLKFPIGEYEVPEEITNEHLKIWIQDIQSFPNRTKELTIGLSSIEKNWKYRPKGWTLKQVVHHCADSHINALTRFKLSLTEETPTIRPYFEARWANLIDGNNDDLTDTFLLLTGLHNKWVKLLSSLTETELNRSFLHPDHGQVFSLKETIGNYAWHCNHHFAHIQQAIDGKGKYN